MKGVPLPRKGIRRGTLSVKNGILKGYGAGPRGGVSPHKTLSRSPGTSIFAEFLKTRCFYTEQGEITVNNISTAFFLPWMVSSRKWGLFSCQIPRGGVEKRGQMPRPPSTLRHFSLIAQSNSAVLSILMCDFLFQLTSSFVIARGF